MLLKDTVYVRDYRDMLRQKLNLRLRRVYAEISHRLTLSIGETALLTNQEIIDGINGRLSKPQLRQTTADRKKAFLLVQRGDLISIYSGQEAKAKAASEIFRPKAAGTGKVTGITASPGRVEGVARIVHTNLDLKKVRSGDILVAHMSRQDYVPVMRRCKGFITDEGGVTCHTAIIARELGAPCLVGTRNATETFRDGDVIELDATNGTARKINPSTTPY